MKRRSVGVRKLNTTVLFFLLFSLIVSAQLYAQKITVINPSFEKPDSGKIKGFDGKCSDSTWKTLINIPGWSVDAPDLKQMDSGVEKDGATDGKYRGFLYGADSAIYQTLNRRVADGDNITLTIDATNIYLGASLKIELYYLNPDTVKVPIVTEVKTLTGSMASYSISFKASEHPDATECNLGILIDNVSKEPASWIGIDNIRLVNTVPGSIEIANYSFEEPDANKIKGWDGVCADTSWKNNVDIPGWRSDVPAFDSGEEQGWTPTDGIYAGWLKGADTSVYNITNYTIKGDEEFQLTVDARDIWPFTEVLQMGLFYVDENNKKVMMESAKYELTNEMYGYSLIANPKLYPNAAGRKIGVWLDNVYADPGSWLAIDNVRLVNTKATTTGVARTETMPVQFSLGQNYPNPFNPSTKISFSIKEAGFVRLNVYNLLGQHITTLVNEQMKAGTYEATFNASTLSSGMYLYKLEAGNNLLVKRMMLLR